MADLAQLLDGSGDETPKLAALHAARVARESDAVEVVRSRLYLETAPAVLAGMLALLGTLGEETDTERLPAFLAHPCDVVVKAALLALRERGKTLDADFLLEQLDGPDAPNPSVVLSLCAELEPNSILSTIWTFSRTASPRLREAVARLLGRLEGGGTLGVLMRWLDGETDEAVLRALCTALKDATAAAGPPTLGTLIGPLYALRKTTTGNKHQQIASLLAFAVQKLGWPEAELDQVGLLYLALRNVGGGGSVSSRRSEGQHSSAVTRRVRRTDRFGAVAEAAPTPSPVTTGRYRFQPTPSGPPSVIPVPEGEGISGFFLRSSARLRPALKSRRDRFMAALAPLWNEPKTRRMAGITALAGVLCLLVFALPRSTPVVYRATTAAPSFVASPREAAPVSWVMSNPPSPAPAKTERVRLKGTVAAALPGSTLVRAGTRVYLVPGSLIRSAKAGQALTVEGTAEPTDQPSVFRLRP